MPKILRSMSYTGFEQRGCLVYMSKIVRSLSYTGLAQRGCFVYMAKIVTFLSYTGFPQRECFVYMPKIVTSLSWPNRFVFFLLFSYCFLLLYMISAKWVFRLCAKDHYIAVLYIFRAGCKK